jgi:hypothetical protein
MKQQVEGTDRYQEGNKYGDVAKSRDATSQIWVRRSISTKEPLHCRTSSYPYINKRITNTNDRPLHQTRVPIKPSGIQWLTPVLPPKLEVLGTVFQVMGIALSRMSSMVGSVFL